MKSIYRKAKEFYDSKTAVFGLTSVQQFFAIILGVALLAFVIVIIMGTLNSSDILVGSSLSQTVVNASGWVNNTGYQLANTSALGFTSPTIIAIINGSSGAVLPSANYTLTGDTVYNATVSAYNSANITWSYKYNSQIQNDADNLLSNTSSGITSFFSSITSVYSILAILVIILVLVVLVKVTTGSTGGGLGRRGSEPQL